MDWIHTRDDISVQKHGGLDKPMDGCEKEKDMWRYGGIIPRNAAGREQSSQSRPIMLHNAIVIQQTRLVLAYTLLIHGNSCIVFLFDKDISMEPLHMFILYSHPIL